jgi:L-threonylcarbamoyladenylate synthase
MKTLQLKVDPGQLKASAAVQALEEAARILRAGGLVALPTETVYGLGANALDPAAVERIFAAKQRPNWDPVIVHIAPLKTRDAMLDGLVEAATFTDRVRRLIEAFWPGPLTLLLPRTRAVPDAVTAGRPLVGVRMPAHPVAKELIRVAGLPLAAPSANLFGHISPTTAAHVLEDLDGRIDAVLDAGPTGFGVESTVLDPGQDPMVIYRPGTVTAEQIRDVAGPVETFRESGLPAETPRQPLPSPGVGLRHYAPRARLVVVEATPEELSAKLASAAVACGQNMVGVMLPADVVAPPGIAPNRIYAWGRWDAPEKMARDLYAGLRALDAQGCAVILCPLPPEDGIGAAIRDRLRKAAR